MINLNLNLDKIVCATYLTYMILYYLFQSELFKALEKTRLVLGDKKDLQYSRCGRTDKGVSSVGQVS